MNRRQFFRLFLVVLLPLVGLGFWLAEDEVVFSQHKWIECRDEGARFGCIPLTVTSRGYIDLQGRAGGVFVSGARLSNGFDEEVVVYSGFESSYSERDGHRAKPTGIGTKKRFQIERTVGADYSGEGHCRIGQIAGNDQLWTLNCGRGTMTFQFDEEPVSAKFAELAKTIRDIQGRSRTIGRYAYAASVLLPMVAFLALSAIAWLLVMAARFVRYGRGGGADSVRFTGQN